MPPSALITGITGQDGSYLAELLLEKGYEVHGIVRRSSSERFDRIEHLRHRITLHQADLLDHRSLVDALRAAQPAEIYNLAAMSFVAVSWIQPTLTAEFTGVGVTRLLEAVREVCPEARFYQASSSEMFGKVKEVPQNEQTAFYPRSPTAWPRSMPTSSPSTTASPTGCTPPAGSSSTTRARAGGWSSSPARSPGTRRPCVSAWSTRSSWATSMPSATGACAGLRQAMWLMLQRDEPEDYVIATGIAHPVRRCLEIAFDQAGVVIDDASSSILGSSVPPRSIT